ncbi:MAG: hypothetical protein D3924_15220, partial [Candidatus Electrothrix sp. AR4]|nr:hypothetical protein [Candidatus Electrothrix sp. AR4]
FDPAGRALHLAEQVTVGISDLIEKSRKRSLQLKKMGRKTGMTSGFGECISALEEEPPGTVQAPAQLYLITVGYAEAYCGEEDMYGKLCEDPCVSSAERPYVIEGVVIRAVPLTLSAELPTSSAVTMSSRHLRSRTASAFFTDEQSKQGSLIVPEGLSSAVWCQGAEAAGGASVPLAVLGRAGETTVFFDAWMARRERMEAPPRQYWAGRMAMRPWKVFLAQVLQFQCQLAQCCREQADTGSGSSLYNLKPAFIARMVRAVDEFASIKKTPVASEHTESTVASKGAVSLDELDSLSDQLAVLEAGKTADRSLIKCGIIELPSAGYLPVSPAGNVTVNQQVRRMMGEGVDLRFCAVRPDYIPHAFEEAQHMERISLLEGLDDPAAKPKVDVLVPDGRIEEHNEEAPGTGYEMDFSLVMLNKPDSRLQTILRGAARSEQLAEGGVAFYYAGQPTESVEGNGIPFSQAVWLSLRIDENPFKFDQGGDTRISAQIEIMSSVGETDWRISVSASGQLRIDDIKQYGSKTHLTCKVRLGGVSKSVTGGNPEQTTQVNLKDEKMYIIRDTAADFRPACQIIGINPLPEENSAAEKASATAQINFERLWESSSTAFFKALLSRHSGNEEQEKPFFSGSQKINNDVLKPGHPLHSASLSALARLGAAMDDSGFADFAARQLFPPPKPIPDELRVFARNDWVLFHRRRDKVCGFDTAPEILTQPRRFRVFH